LSHLINITYIYTYITLVSKQASRQKGVLKVSVICTEVLANNALPVMAKTLRTGRLFITNNNYNSWINGHECQIANG